MGERSLEALDVTWARTAPAPVLREAVLMGLLGPAMDFSTRRTMVGLEHFERLQAPVGFVANHSSHMDMPEILRGAETTPAERSSELAGATAA
jgi:1-acyl-sn-glycerol-3-phosphate acyltransferase